MSKRVLVTGGMGFIGSNFILYMLNKYSDIHITNMDALTYAGNPDNLADIERLPNYRFVYGDITDAKRVEQLFTESFDVVVHFAAESHVDRSIMSPFRFVNTNVTGTHHLLEAARKSGVNKFIQVSTDEVYGSLGDSGYFTENTPLSPNSPYSASKAAADLLARSYYHTYGFPVVITRCSNNYGPRQFPEKLLPLAITNVLENRKIPVYGDGLNIRDWLHVHDHCSAIDAVIERGKVGEVYNIGGNNEQTNLSLVRQILAALGKSESMIEFVADRLGHDRRYAIDASKITFDLGWSPSYDSARGLQETLDWYTANVGWWRKIDSGDYLSEQNRLRKEGIL